MRSQPATVSESLFQSLGLLGLRHVLLRRANLPPSAAASSAYMVALAANLPLRAAMREAAMALAAADVKVIVYKGQEYLDRIYGDLGARPMADVDLLVRPEDAERAEAALISAGFVLDTHCRTMHERKLVKNGMAIDLHRALLQDQRMAIPTDALFARAEPSRAVPGLWVLEASDALLVHCIAQTVKGYCLPASSYVELQALLAHANHARVLALAKSFRACSALYASLRALGAFGHAVARELARRVPLSLARRACLDALVATASLHGAVNAPRAVLLARKALLIDDVTDACRFTARWLAFQLGGADAAVRTA